MKKIITLSMVAIFATGVYADAEIKEQNSTQKQIDALQAQIEQMQKDQDAKIAKLEKKAKRNAKKISAVN